MKYSLLEIEDLRTYFHIGESVKKALDGVSLSIGTGETVGVVGISGSGKTVLARSIMVLVRDPGFIAGGSIRFQGNDLLSMPESMLGTMRGKDLSMIVSSPRSRLNPLLPVGSQIANVIRAKQSLTKKATKARVLGLLADVAIGDPSHVTQMYPHELSGGMCQRMIIAMALANSPRLLLADEPTANLDVTIQRQVLELMSKLVNETGTGLLLMTRDLGIVARYCQRVAVLRDGRIIEEGPVDAFFKKPQQEHSRLLLQAAFAAKGSGEIK